MHRTIAAGFILFSNDPLLRSDARRDHRRRGGFRRHQTALLFV